MAKRNRGSSRNFINPFSKKQSFKPFIKQKKNLIIERFKEEKMAERFVENVQGLKITEKEFKEMKGLIKQVNRQNTVKYERIANKKLITYGKETDMTIADRIAMESGRNHSMGSLYSQKYGYLKHELLNRFQQFETKEEFKDYVQWLKKRSSPTIQKQKLKQYKSNYIKSLFTAYGDTKEVRALVNAIKKLKPNKVEEIYLTHEQAFITYNYNQNDSYDKRIETLLNIWTSDAQTV